MFMGVFAQRNNSPYTPNVHSPETSSLGKYLDYPVDLSTGVPKIEIPLYEVISGSLKLPITLSYHASGIKVNQEESNVGLGWNLNAGGAIIRNIKDIPDDYQPDGFLYTGNSIPVYNDINNDSSGPLGQTGNNDVLKSYYGYNNGYSATHKDNYSDSYSLNTNVGLSGEFYINNNLQFVSADFDPVNINANLSNNTIVLKDDKGNTYRFGKSLQNESAFEKITSFSSPQNSTPTTYIPYTSSWYLTEIISADGSNTIEIKYKKISDYNTASFVEKRSYVTNVMVSVPTEHKSTYSQTVLGYTIDKIIFKEGVAQFEYAFDRKDRPGQPNDIINIPRISGLTVYNKNNEVIKKVVLENNDYFSRFASSLLYEEYYHQPIPTEHLKSLKLNGVRFVDKYNNLIGKYSFDYDQTSLPTKNSGSVDFWGYYNGKSNTTLLPTPKISGVYTSNSFDYSKRETDFNFMKAGVLTKITYPTGGASIYEYEPNYFLTPEQEQGMAAYQGGVGAYALKSDTNCSDGQNLTTSPYTVKEYQITNDTSGPIDFDVFFSDYYRNGTPFSPPTAKIKIGLFEKTIVHTQNGAQTPMKVESFSTSIQKGATVRIELNINNASAPSMSSPCSSPFISVSGRYTYYAPAPPQNIQPKQAGGLRVKSISSYDNNNTLVLKKSYDYGTQKMGSNNVGIGKILSNPYQLENYYKTLDLLPDNSNSSSCQSVHKEIVWLNSSPMVELGYNNGNPVYYDKVTEYIEDKSDATKTIGKTENFYSSQGLNFLSSADNFKSYNTFIYPYWKKGNLLKKINYKQENNQYFPIYSEEYKYSDIIESRIRTLNIFEKDSEYESAVCSWGSLSGYTVNNPNRFRYFNDYISVGKRILTNKFTVDSRTGTDLLTTTTYQYNNPVYQLTKEQVSHPDTSVTEFNYSYAHEKNNQKLITANMVGVPLETIIIEKPNAATVKTVSRSETKYDVAANLFPSSILSYNILDNTPSTEVTYDLYDVKGNLQQYTTKDGISTTIIWGYNSTQPIAKIVGGKLSDITQSLITSIVNASNDDNIPPQGTTPVQAEQNLILALDNFRKNSGLSAYQITTYTYDPLIGVTSITPPSGIREVYVYDTANRLQEIRQQEKDTNGNLVYKTVKEFKYNYKN